ncbi:hypothetical protein KFK09_009159 [Dendrobium nobile]|uniref:Uncharacterized protein n=1 Tax=Dendrobium nobile TaxID=94219 RepID=A0A8T3BM31_DENNO|nr:hypothetical protein KFK09_009159 [Dendrobium nobile]
MVDPSSTLAMRHQGWCEAPLATYFSAIKCIPFNCFFYCCWCYYKNLHLFSCLPKCFNFVVNSLHLVRLTSNSQHLNYYYWIKDDHFSYKRVELTI